MKVQFSHVLPTGVEGYTAFIKNRVLTNPQTEEAFMITRELNVLEKHYPTLNKKPSAKKPHALLTYAFQAQKGYQGLEPFTQTLRHLIYAVGLIPMAKLPLIAQAKVKWDYALGNPYLELGTNEAKKHFKNFRGAVEAVYKELQPKYKAMDFAADPEGF